MPLLFDKRQIDPFQVENLAFIIQPTKTGNLSLNPKVVYLNTADERTISKSKSNNLIVKQNAVKNTEATTHNTMQRPIADREQINFEFKTKLSLSAFEYLIHSFISDYMNRKLSSENSGWRTLTEIMKGAKITKFSVYGANSRKGRVLLELESRGLIEVRVFKGERGRGGKIVRARICYEKDPVKHLIEQKVLEK